MNTSSHKKHKAKALSLCPKIFIALGLFATLLIYLVLSSSLALAASPDTQENGETFDNTKSVTMDFQQADIHQLIRYISEVTGRNFITDPAVKGRITVYSPVRITPEEAFDTFVSILRVHGYAVQKTGSAYTILPFKEGLGKTGDILVGETSIGVPQSIETRIIPLKQGIASEVAKVLPSLLVSDYAVSAYTPSNTLAITASKESMNLVLSFLEEVEASHRQGYATVITLKYGNAETLSEVIGTMLKGRDTENQKRGITRASLVEPDNRTNTLVIYGDSETLELAKATIKKLDIPTPEGKGDVHHVTLANAKAEDLAEVLNSLVERQVSSSSADEEYETVLSRDIKVVPDPATNSLVITAKPDEFEALDVIIKKLDIVRNQVFIEALIMEVNAESSFAFGINWAAAQESGDFAILGGVNLDAGAISLSSSGGISLPSGLSLGGIMMNAFSIGGTEYNIQSLLNLVKNNSDVNVLATPQLLTLDNEEASVEVVDNIPFNTGSTASNDGTYTTQSMDYKDVGVKLKITPRISDDGSLRLEVEQEVSRVTQGVINLDDGTSLVAPTTRKRLIKSTILLHDEQTAVIGGLLDDRTDSIQSGVPVLSEIPVLGWLFKSTQETKTETTLFVFITPKVIRSLNDSLELTASKQMEVHQTGIDENGLGKLTIGRPKMPKPVFVY